MPKSAHRKRGLRAMASTKQNAALFQVSVVRQESNPSQGRKHAINVYDLRVWGEINYLDSSTDYREYLGQPTSHSSDPEELEFLDDQSNFPWIMIVKSASVIAAVCVILLIVTSNS